ncbi:macrolide family glycosyltransferase [Paenibacillus sp. L3-i20]|uniref:macrolide family glycosyltransferase n=1 Tax=Paenibacillus sp. L3-i20 TaxID=2905833 RepID=UPI001EDD5869|nr:macrolide family glycosyltransferase [Paenibacillus sp. L3-i20]GKU76574.1 glycosyl transferase family 1 [Paenibacillus sp. L3-i20]
MSRVVFFGIDLHGHVNPTLGLIHRLIEKGEEVTYYSNDSFRAKIEGTGATFRSYRDLFSFGRHIGTGVETMIVLADFLMNKCRILVDALHDEVAQLRPDYIIHDTFCPWGKELAAKLNIPGIAVFANFPFIDEMAKKDPAFFMEYVLLAADDPLYIKYKGQHDVYRKLLDKLSRVIALKYGNREVNVMNDIFCSKEKLNLVFTSREFQIHEETFDDTHRFVGYEIYPRVEPYDFPFEQLNGRPLIYIAFGTILHNLSELYQACFDALGDTDYQVVMSLGIGTDESLYTTVPDNFIVRPYVPQLKLLSMADVFITHGGANSVYESVCNSVPMLVIPQVFDEFMGAMMVERSGTGIFMRTNAPNREELQESIRQLITNPQYKQNCRYIKQSFEATGGIDYAVNEIIQFAKQKVCHE